MGAHIDGDTGNILMSRLLEQTLYDLDIEKVFIRPSYYFSNWLGFMETVEQYGVLPSFIPENLAVEMNSLIDVAKFIAEKMTDNATTKKRIYELKGQQKYSPLDVANILSKLLNKPIAVQAISRENWKETLLSFGFTESSAINLSDMTRALVDSIAIAEFPQTTAMLPTSLETYLGNSF